MNYSFGEVMSNCNELYFFRVIIIVQSLFPSLSIASDQDLRVYFKNELFIEK